MIHIQGLLEEGQMVSSQLPLLSNTPKAKLYMTKK